MPPRTGTATATTTTPRTARKTQSAHHPSVAHLANDLRLACMRISRRVRFESTQLVAPHQLSVMARLENNALTPRELAAIECVSPPSMTRTVAALVERGLVARQDDPMDGRQVFLSLTAPGLLTLKRLVANAMPGWRPGSGGSARTNARCWSGQARSSPGWPANEPHVLLLEDLQLSRLCRWRTHLQHRDLDGPGCTGLAGADPADPALIRCARDRDGAAVRPSRTLGAGRGDDHGPVPQATHPVRYPECHGPDLAAHGRSGGDRYRPALAHLPAGRHPGSGHGDGQPGPSDFRLRDGAARVAEQRSGPQQCVLQRSSSHWARGRGSGHRGFSHRSGLLRQHAQLCGCFVSAGQDAAWRVACHAAAPREGTDPRGAPLCARSFRPHLDHGARVRPGHLRDELSDD